jgi:light-regulated signal transduction histidine kinase (bacteriophytochrome)
MFDIVARLGADWLVVEIEPATTEQTSAAVVLSQLSAAAGAFERSADLKALCARGAVEFRRLTGFDRVMIYRFLDDEAGVVLAEDVVEGMPSFMNHRFPGSDIPGQARALYVRNRVRVIPDIAYTPAPMRPAWAEPEPLDMSDCALRSVSPVHMQYMRNMGVGASASVSIVKDGVLWGLIACHHRTAMLMPYDVRVAAQALAEGFARQIRAKEEADLSRERMRLRDMEDMLRARFERLGGLETDLSSALPELQRLLDADGIAAVRGSSVHRTGVCPANQDIRRLVEMISAQPATAWSTDNLKAEWPEGERLQESASGVLAVVVDAQEPFVLTWFRAEQVQEVEWAGNPHKQASTGPGGLLTPRASFEAWRETVRGRARAWRPAELESAARLGDGLTADRAHRRVQTLADDLQLASIAKDGLLQQKELLLKEVNHRIQNSLQLVSSFLALQGRDSPEPMLQAAFEEARRRLSAVALVHRRLYRGDEIEEIDFGRYVDELVEDMGASMGSAWAGQVTAKTQEVTVPTDRAVTLALVINELIINAQKYAYGGAPGPLSVNVATAKGQLRIEVADQGVGGWRPSGFGSRMMAVMIKQLAGELTFEDNTPGVRAVLTASARGGRPAH